MDPLHESSSRREARTQEPLDFRGSGSLRESSSRREALESRRSGSITSSRSAHQLSIGEEDELEGEAGDSGVLRFHDPATENARGLGSLHWSSSRKGATIQEPLDFRGSGSLRESSSRREARIQEVLDSRRSGSITSGASARELSDGEEDELEGLAGDSGSLRFYDPAMETARDPGMGEDGRATPVRDEDVLPINACPPAGELTHQAKLPSSMEFLSILACLATFGILGVLIRFLTERLFGPHVANLTSSRTALFPDLPANMLGSFFMGWVGVVFKKNIALFSDHLAVGLSTGLMGSITTFASMMQRMLSLMVAGKWVPGLFGLLAGVYLSQMSLEVGVDSARLLLRTLKRANHKGSEKSWKPSPETVCRRWAGLGVFLFLGIGLWAAAAALTAKDRDSTTRRTLWLACVVAPPGVWIRWYFARLNGRGIGPEHRRHLRWFPVGTFLVNVGASSLEAGVACAEVAAENYTATLLAGSIQLGTLGCMSTVSTFAAEIQTMHQGLHRGRAYIYVFLSVGVSLIIGLVVYGIPTWILGYESRYLRT